MHILVLVVIPSGVLDADSFVRMQMEKHRRKAEMPEGGRWDYFVVGGNWDGKIIPRDSVGAPSTVKNNICSIERMQLQGEVADKCGALVTPDGCWHSYQEFDSQDAWTRRWQSLLRENSNGDVVIIDAHS